MLGNKVDIDAGRRRNDVSQPKSVVDIDAGRRRSDTSQPALRYWGPVS
jgi:hypothetical protein